MELPYNSHVRTAHVACRGVVEECFGRHGFGPYALHSVTTSEPFAMNHHSGYEEFLHASGIECDHAVEVGTFPVGLRPCFHLLLQAGAEYAQHVSYQTSYKVVLKRYVALGVDVFLFGHSHSVGFDHIVPLSAVGVVFVATSLCAEVAAGVVACHCKGE